MAKRGLPARDWVLYLLNKQHESERLILRLADGSEHLRGEPQDYDPTPHCALCHKAWDQTGGYKPEYRCPASPGAMVDEIAHTEVTK